MDMDVILSPALIIMNIAYVLNLIGLAVRNFLLLRLILISSQCILIYTGYVLGNWIVMFWNAIFLVINLYRAILLLLERRPVKLPEDMQDLYKDNFFYMTEREFLRFWKLGKAHSVTDDYVINAGSDPESVFIITRGMATVKNQNGIIAILGRGGFIGEMSYVSGRTPAADVLAGEVLELRAWKRADLNKLKIRDHSLWVKMQQALGHDLVEKVNRMSEKNSTKE